MRESTDNNGEKGRRGSKERSYSTTDTCSDMARMGSTFPQRQRRVSTRWEFVLYSVRVQVLVLLLSFLTSAGAFIGRHKHTTTSRTLTSRELQISRRTSRPADPLYSLFRGKSAQNEPGRSRVNGIPSQTQTSSPTKLEWEVFVDQSKSSLDKGGSATLDAFVGLSPPGTVKVQPVILSRIKSKGPLVRCISGQNSDKSSFDVSNVDSVDKVYRILTSHMRVGVSEERMNESIVTHTYAYIYRVAFSPAYPSLHFLKPFVFFTCSVPHSRRVSV
jgi:hypothetical protein